MSTWRQVISLLTLKIEFQTIYVNIFKKKSCLFFPLFDRNKWFAICQRKVKGYHTTELFLSALGAYHIHIHKGIIITYVRTEKKRDLSRWKIFILSTSIRVCKGKMCTRSTTSIITFMCQQLSFVVSFLSWVNEKKQQLTGAIHACKCRQSFFHFYRNKRLN